MVVDKRSGLCHTFRNIKITAVNRHEGGISMLIYRDRIHVRCFCVTEDCFPMLLTHGVKVGNVGFKFSPIIFVRELGLRLYVAP